MARTKKRKIRTRKRIGKKMSKHLEMLLKERFALDVEEREIKARKESVTQEVVAIMDEYDLEEFTIKDSVYRKQRNKYVNWDGAALRQFMVNKFGLNKANQAVKQVKTITHEVNDDYVLKMIRDDEVNTDTLGKFISMSFSKPFIRIYRKDK